MRSGWLLRLIVEGMDGKFLSWYQNRNDEGRLVHTAIGEEEVALERVAKSVGGQVTVLGKVLPLNGYLGNWPRFSQLHSRKKQKIFGTLSRCKRSCLPIRSCTEL
jgi:hypothetical protein